ncbi:RNA-directed DNA polymerase, eukaryota, Reverse transcriptase zinc-binding domain protein [Artemisia annua]|uniref:RNA-directed DNA polymerase, eukaryota, Reverse transcriptase zinc-binding domain protein n=1 Tax=Artemisia annua TaxID=35608 RepID=A0A2U1M6Q9_ARTAN|nr:RNA-directed DNA polymerase, eukaryota, Reverse transcriptase zinc-binding domain protein [Artemisia annua]
MEKVGAGKVDVEGLQARMARLNKDAGNSDGTQPKQAYRVLKNPNLESNKNVHSDKAASGLNTNTKVDTGGVTFNATNVNTLEPVINVEEDSYPPLRSTPVAATTDYANLPTGDGVGVSKQAGRFTLIDSNNVSTKTSCPTTSSEGKSHTMDLPTDSNHIVQSVEVESVPKSYVGATTDDGFQQVGKKRNRNKGKTMDNNEGIVSKGFNVGKNMYYMPKSAANPSQASTSSGCPEQVGASKANTTPSNDTPSQGVASTSTGPPKQVGTSNARNDFNANVTSQPNFKDDASNSYPIPKVNSPNVAANVSTSNPFDSLAFDVDGKTGSYKLPNEVGSGSYGSISASIDTNLKSTLVDEGKNTYSSPSAVCEKSCDDGVLIGKAGHDDTLKDPPSRHDVPSLVVTDLSKPVADTLNIDNNLKIFSHEDWMCQALKRQVVLGLPTVVCSETGIRLIAERVGRLMRMDEGTSAMCINPWGRNSFARCLIELSAIHDLLEFVKVDIPLPNGKGHYTEYIDIEYEWWPPRCSHCKIFSHEEWMCQALKRQVVLGSDSEHVSAKEKVHVMKAGKKGTKPQLGSSSVGDPSASGSLWEQFNASTSNIKSSVSVLEDSDDEVDEVLEMEGGGFLNDMEDYYDEYDDQVVLPDKLQAIYNYYVNRRALWSNLVSHASFMRNRPWVLLGDFNAALNLEDHSCGGYAPDIAMCEFKQCVLDMEVMDVNSTGLHFTWNQKPRGSNGILKKIDRIMGNLKFGDIFPGSFAIFQPYRISDHSPCVLRILT